MEALIKSITVEIKGSFEGESTGHDWWHIYRVVNNARSIQEQEGGNAQLIELSALLHDVGDHKFHKEKDAQERMISNLLLRFGAETSVVNEVLEIVKQVSFKGGKENLELTSLEAKIVQDADRLDAIGAMGIARAFAFGGNRNRMIYDPNDAPKNFENFEAYKNDKGHTINHFYEKLLKLKDMMQTPTGKRLAAERHQFMEVFLGQFYKEWEGKA